MNTKICKKDIGIKHKRLNVYNNNRLKALIELWAGMQTAAGALLALKDEGQLLC